MTGKQKVFEKHRIRMDRINPLLAALGIGCAMLMQTAGVGIAKEHLPDKREVTVTVDVAGNAGSPEIRRTLKVPAFAAEMFPVH